MYTIDSGDRVVPLEGVPQSSVGAPLPIVVADERSTMVAFLVQTPLPRGWAGMAPSPVGLDSSELAAIVRFEQVAATYFGGPNDEAFDGHPLAIRGLQPYSASRIENSSWIRRLAAINSVHPRHRPAAFAGLIHVVLAFHDSTFECVARSLTVEVLDGPLSRIAVEMAQRLSD